MNGYAVTASATYAEESDVNYRIESALQKKKVKKPGFISRWLMKKLVEGSEFEKRQSHERETAISVDKLSRSMAISASPQSIDQPERAIQFTVYNANGGRVIETRRYDRQKDRNHNGLYIVTSDQDFGHEIDKIITMESLKS
jgi:hypothetical protein